MRNDSALSIISFRFDAEELCTNAIWIVFPLVHREDDLDHMYLYTSSPLYSIPLLFCICTLSIANLRRSLCRRCQTTIISSSRAHWSLQNLQKINVQEFYTRQRQSLRPWFEFFNTTKFKAPANFQTGTRRLIANVEHFQTNYFVVIIVLSIYCIITTPSLLFVLMAIAAGCYLVTIKNRERPVVILGRQIPLSQQYIAVLALCIPLLILVGAGSAIFWILGASVFVIVLHAVFHQTPNQDAFGLQMEEV